MTQISSAWGSGPSLRYEALAEPFRPLFRDIAASAVAREIDHILPLQEIRRLKELGFTRLRVPVEAGGLGASLPEFFNLQLELAEADPNVTNALRAHFGFVEDVLYSPSADWQAEWLPRIVAGETLGSGFTEVGDAKQATFSTRIVRSNGHYVVNGRKFYTTGSLLADWINIGGVNEAEETVWAAVPRRADGVEIVDDWDGFGQQLTASGTATFDNVALDGRFINPSNERFRYSPAFFQLVHLATLAGIGRAAARDVADLVRERKRTFSHANAPLPAQDAQILQIVGKVRGAAYAAGAIVLKSAEAVERVVAARQTGDLEAVEAAVHIAEIEVSQAQTVVSNLIIESTSLLFDALGASSARKGLGLDRHWRNARTISSHNPRIYKDRIVGDFAVNGTPPPPQWRIGVPTP